MLTSFEFAEPELVRLARKFVEETSEFISANRHTPGVGWPLKSLSPPARASEGSCADHVLILVLPVGLRDAANLESASGNGNGSPDDLAIWISEVRRRTLSRRHRNTVGGSSNHNPTGIPRGILARAASA